MHFVAVLLVISAATLIEPFNVDLEVPLLKSYEGDAAGKNIAFGASVTIRKASRSPPTIVVGAPKSNHTNDPKFHDTGGVFVCDVDDSRTCTLINADFTIDIPGQDDNRTSQLFGQLVSSVNGRTIICAPLYRLNRTQSSGEDKPVASYYAVGRCFAYADETDLATARKYLIGPCGSLSVNNDNFAQCAIGMSVNSNNEENEADQFFAFGAPAAQSGTGGAFYGNWLALQNEDMNRNPIYIRTGQESITGYIGYSVGVGKFTSAGSRIVVGAPKRMNYLGEVLMYNQVVLSGGSALDKVTLNPGLVGDQFGAMFGYAIVVANLDGDASLSSEIVVSAPYYGSLNKMNTGRIYVYKLTLGGGGFDPLGDPIDGRAAGGLFGLAMSFLGDINLDGFHDIAVSAPFENNGVVYIYNGYPGGLRSAPQRIESESVKVPGSMMSFGFAVSRGDDVDENKYPDFVVGAYQSNNAVLLRSRPVVIVTTTMETIQSISLLENTRQTFNLSFCVKYTNRKNVDPISNLKVRYELILDKNNAVSRLETTGFDGKPTSTLTSEVDLTPDVPHCYNLTVSIKQNIQDKSSRFVNVISARLPDYTNTPPTLAAPPATPPPLGLPLLYPVLDIAIPSSTEKDVKISRDCPAPPADKCTPDLISTITELPDSVIAGSETLIEISMRVENNFSEASFRTQVIIQFPTQNLVYINYTLSTTAAPLLGCSSHERGAICDIGNPLPDFSQITLVVSLQQKLDNPLIGNEGSITISMNATSEDGDYSGRSADNFQEKSIEVVARSKLTLTGLSLVTADDNPDPRPEVIIPPGLLGDILARKPVPNRVEIAHRYSVRNSDSTTVPRVQAEIFFPYYDVKNEVNLIKNITAEYSLLSTRPCSIDLNRDAANCPDGNIIQCALVTCNVEEPLIRFGFLSITVKGDATLEEITRFASAGGNLASSAASLKSKGTAKTVADYILESVVDSQVSTRIVMTIQTNECVQIWYIVVSVIGSLLILTVVIIILYSCGFFKMKHRYDMSEGGMIAKREGPQDGGGAGAGAGQERFSRVVTPPALASDLPEKKAPPPAHDYEDPRPASSHRNSGAREYVAEPGHRRSQTSLPPPVDTYNEEPPARRVSRGGGGPGFKVFDEEPKARRPSSPGSMGEGGVTMRDFDREPRRSIGSGGGGQRYSGNDVDGRRSYGSGEPTSPKKYTETIM